MLAAVIKAQGVARLHTMLGRAACVTAKKKCKPKKIGRLALNKRSGRLSLKACDAQKLGHNRYHAV